MVTATRLLTVLVLTATASSQENHLGVELIPQEEKPGWEHQKSDLL